MLLALHQSVEFLRLAGFGSKLFQPLTEHSVQSLMTRFGQQARLLNELFIRTQGNVFIR